VDALVGQGQVLLAAKKHAAAIPVYVRLLNQKNVPPRLREHALHQQAVRYYRLKQYANMRKCYEDLLLGFPQGDSAPEAMYWLAWYDASEKRYRESTEMYGRLMAAFPDHMLAEKARYRRALGFFRAGEEEKAAEALYEILTKYPKIQIDQKEILWLGKYYMNHERLNEAYGVYDLLLTQRPELEVRALALYYQAEVKRRRQEWKEALAKYERLLAEKDTGLENAACFGLAVCQRHLGQPAEARKTLGQVELSNQDPLVAYYYLELGLLDFAEKQYGSAGAHLMRVGLLYDNESLCGEALLKAYEACRLSGDTRKAVICLNELAGVTPGGYGQRYAESLYTAEGKRLLRAFAETKTLAPAEEPAAASSSGPELE